MSALIRKGLSGTRQLVSWYLSPIGLLYGLLLVVTIVLALLGEPEGAVVALALACGVVVPWKLVRQRNELRAHVASSNAVLSRVDAQVLETPTFDQVEKTMTGFRRANRKVVREVREQLVEVRIEQANQQRTINSESQRAAELYRDASQAVDRFGDVGASVAALTARLESLEQAASAAGRN